MEDRFDDDFYIENTEELNQLEYDTVDSQPIYKSVRVSKKDFSIFELYRKFEQKKLVLDVDFQRNYVWEGKQKSELIESILMGLPLPIFYLKQQDDTTYVVVDGKQRLTTLFMYLNNEFALKNLKILKFLNGKKFKDLQKEYGIYQSQLEDYQIYCHIILPPTPDRILFDIFDRVNRGGTKLNKQEIRNALYHGRGLNMINEITDTDLFQTVTKIEKNRDRRMKGSYLLTRFFSFYLLLNGILDKKENYTYKGDVDELIEKTLVFLNNSEGQYLRELKQEALRALDMSYQLFENGSFRKNLNASNPINMNIFETSMYLMTLIDYNKIEGNLKQIFYSTITGDKFLGCIGDSRDSTQKVQLRFELMHKIAQEAV